jgi:hypothetical protein
MVTGMARLLSDEVKKRDNYWGSAYPINRKEM